MSYESYLLYCPRNSIDSTCQRLSRKGVYHSFRVPSLICDGCIHQDGYTLEEVDLYGLENGQEKVIIPNAVVRSF